jgi:probable phosphoglycerate mutase
MCGGKWNIDLNQNGLKQAQSAAEILKRYPMRCVAVSPLLRALRTAELVAQHHGLKPVIVDELAEWDIGRWDRMPFETVKDEFLGTGEPQGGETRQQFKQRIRVAIEKCRPLESPLLIVAHGAVWLTLQEILGIPPTKVDNGIPFEVSLDETGKWLASRIDSSLDEKTQPPTVQTKSS